MNFFQALADPDLGFLRYALITGLLASFAFGMMGSLVVVRRISYLAAAIAHCVLGGIGAALYFRETMGWAWLDPMLGAVVAALLGALAIGLVTLKGREREDTVIGAMWSVGMAVGLFFLAKTPGYVDPMSYIWGDILLVSRGSITMVAILDLMVVALVLLNYNKLAAICFDEEFPKLRGVSVDGLYLLMLVLTALTVVLMVDLLGIVLVIALLTLPAAIAGRFSHHLWQMMLTAIGLCMLFTAAGLGLSYEWQMPSGPTIAILAGAAFLAVMAVERLTKRN